MKFDFKAPYSMLWVCFIVNLRRSLCMKSALVREEG